MENASASFEGFGEVVAKMVAEHVESQQKAGGDLVRKAGRKTASELRKTSPKRTGRYAAGWGMTSESDSDDHVEVTVHNKRRWQLTHLLEKGHVKFIFGHNTGERVRAIPHIAPAYEVGAEMLRNASVDNG